MQDIYENYYGQNKKVILRLWEPKDAQDNYLDDLNSECMALVQEEITLPPLKRVIELNGSLAEPNNNSPAFSIETLNGDYIGNIHYNFINERLYSLVGS